MLILTYREKRTFKNATDNSHISYICSNTNYITMKTKQLKRVKALLQALKNRVGYSELSKDETKE